MNDNNKIQVLPIPIKEYHQASQRFSIIWNEYVKREEEVKTEVVNMVKFLESNGYSRTKEVAKIISDHNHLKGFSKATIYREFPVCMKRRYESSDIIMLPKYEDISNETLDEYEHEIGYGYWCYENRGVDYLCNNIIQAIDIHGYMWYGVDPGCFYILLVVYARRI